MTELTVSVAKTIQAPIEKVFDAWLDPKMLSNFILPAPGMPNPDVENDPKVGGQFSILMRVGENEVPHTGEYLELVRPDKLVFTWVSPFSGEGSTVTLDFSSVDSNTTQVDLTHRRFPNEESRNNHEQGWGNILGKLAEVCAQ